MNRTLVIDTDSEAGSWLRAARDGGIEFQEYRPRTSLKADCLSGFEGWPPEGTSDDGHAEEYNPLRMASNQAFLYNELKKCGLVESRSPLQGVVYWDVTRAGLAMLETANA